MASGLYMLRDTKKNLGRIFMPLPNKNTAFPFAKSVANNKGFTLAEVMVALTLLAIGVMAVVSLFTVSMHSNQKANQYTAANNLAQQALEDILAKSITDPVYAQSTTLTTYYPVTNPSTTSSPTPFIVTGAGTYTITYVITLGTTANGIGTENASVAVSITGTGIVGMTFTGFKRLV